MLKLQGIAHRTAAFLQEEHLCRAPLWKKFVDVFRSQPDGRAAWRGEYWGKMMRGAVLVYQYTHDEHLYNTLTDTVRDMLTVAEPDGRVSSYTRENEFNGWDLWCRKYVILACEYYLEICRDEQLKQQILTFISRCADHVLENIGPGKKKITETSQCWLSINSSSILEPMVRLYQLTGEQRYLDFSAYIIEEGGANGVNVFELAYENRIYPYQYGVAKAYEMISCFEGLLEYYKVTGIEKYKTAVLNFANAVLDSEISIIGSCGITHELFDYTKARQTVPYDGVQQETCVTVTLMKFMSRLLDLTHDSRYADIMEKAFYNAYLGALNTEHREALMIRQLREEKPLEPTDLPFDSYSPLIPGKRGQKVGGYQRMPDSSYYGCCACIGAAGAGVFLNHAVMPDEDGVTVQFYERGSFEWSHHGVPVRLTMDTDYPADGNVTIRIYADSPVRFTLRLRNPAWAEMPTGYTVYTRIWENDSIDLSWDMPIRLHIPYPWEHTIIYTDMTKVKPPIYTATAEEVYHDESEEHYVAVTRGPLTLAADSRTGKPAGSVFSVPRKAELCENNVVEGVPCLVKMKFQPKDDEPFYLVDYAHAGRDWETEIAAWLPTRER